MEHGVVSFFFYCHQFLQVFFFVNELNLSKFCFLNCINFIILGCVGVRPLKTKETLEKNCEKSVEAFYTENIFKLGKTGTFNDLHSNQKFRVFATEAFRSEKSSETSDNSTEVSREINEIFESV
jgi:hypothetical protein